MGSSRKIEGVKKLVQIYLRAELFLQKLRKYFLQCKNNLTEGGISFENRSLKAERLCTEDGKSYEEGDSFPSPYDDCNECSCDCYDYEG